MRIDRMDGGPSIVIADPAAVIVDYYRSRTMHCLRRSGGYDRRGPDPHPDRITREDIAIANQIAAHLWGNAWPAILGAGDQPCLAELPVGTDAGAGTPEEREGHLHRIDTAIHALTGGRPKSAGITKILHLKRPRMVPLVDSVIRAKLGADPAAAIPGDALMATVRHLVDESARLAPALDRAIAEACRAEGTPEISRLRALDILIWVAHPADGGG